MLHSIPFFGFLLLCSVCSPLFVFVRIQACQLLLQQQQQQQPQQQQQQLLQNQRKFTPNLRQQADPQQVPIKRMNLLSFVISILLPFSRSPYFCPMPSAGQDHGSAEAAAGWGLRWQLQTLSLPPRWNWWRGC